MKRGKERFLILISAVFFAAFLASCGHTETEKSENSLAEVQPGAAMGYEETVKYEEKEGYVAGDIILADGLAVKVDAYTAIDENNLPVAVIVGFRDDGKALGVGVHRSSEPLQWAVEGAAEGTADNTEKYPAFQFAGMYGQNSSLTGDYASGWYLPCIEELEMVYENRRAINNALQKIYGLDANAAMNGLGTNWYWSSSQSDSEKDYAWFIHYYNGYAGECPKTFTNLHVLVVRAF